MSGATPCGSSRTLVISEERITEVINFLVPREWMGLLERDDEGILPTCCGNISQLRDVLSTLLVERSTRSLIAAGQALEAEGDQHFESGPLIAFAGRVYELLDSEYLEWRSKDLAAEAKDTEAWMLKLTTAQTSSAPDAELAPYGQWAAAFDAAGKMMENGLNSPEEVHFNYREACENLRLAGAPTAVVNAMWHAGVEAWRAQ